MPVNVAKNAVSAKPKISGGVLIAPVGTALPTNETTALNAAFVNVGYIGEKGVSRGEKVDTDTKKAWGGDVVQVITKSITYTAKLSLLEYVNGTVQALIYGATNITVTAPTISAGTKVAIKGTTTDAPHNSWVFEVFSGGAKGRVIFPDAQITDRADYALDDSELTAREVTLTLFPDSNGVYFNEYWDNGVTL